MRKITLTRDFIQPLLSQVEIISAPGETEKNSNEKETHEQEGFSQLSPNPSENVEKLKAHVKTGVENLVRMLITSPTGRIKQSADEKPHVGAGEYPKPSRYLRKPLIRTETDVIAIHEIPVQAVYHLMKIR